MSNIIMVNELYNTCATIEMGFNIAACIPVVGVISGHIRGKAGKTQLQAGLVIGAVGLVCSLATGNKNWENVAYLGGKFIIHGALNVIRGLGETVWGLGIVSSPLLIIPNMIYRFGPVISYN